MYLAKNKLSGVNGGAKFRWLNKRAKIVFYKNIDELLPEQELIALFLHEYGDLKYKYILKKFSLMIVLSVIIFAISDAFTLNSILKKSRVSIR